MPDLGEPLPSTYIELTANNPGTINVGTGNSSTNPIFLAKFQVIQVGNPPEQLIPMIDGAVNGIIKRDSGSGSIKFGFITSTDDVDYDGEFMRILGSGASESAQVTGGAGFITTTQLFFAICAFNSDGSTSGTVRNAITTLKIQLPPQYILTRLI